MHLDKEQFEATIQRLEIFAREQPTNYRLRVGLLAVLGYAYIFMILTVLLALLALFVLLIVNSKFLSAAMLKPGIFLFWLIFLLLRSLWVSFPPPIGLPLSRPDVPNLLALVDELTSKLKAPRLHQILLVDEFNAAIVQRPRLGLFGWQQNYLILGLPLMQALSPEQFRGVIAHELGHLSANHSRFAGWIYRVRLTWWQIFQRLQQTGNQASWLLFEGFFNWYIPFFNAYSFVLARMDEYEADRCAVKLAGSQNVAEALINVTLKRKFLEHSYWSGIYKQVEHLIEPPAKTYTSMSLALYTGATLQEASLWLEQALAEKTSYNDTHPCLRERLQTLEYFPVDGKLLIPAPIKISAAQEFLRDKLQNLTSYFDRTWQEKIATPWRQRYAYIQESLAKLKTLNEKAQNQPLTLEEAWECAYRTSELKEAEVAIPLLQQVLTMEPNHTLANFTLGKMLLQKHDPTGIDHIEKAIAQKTELTTDGYQFIYFFLTQQGNIKVAQVYRERLQKYYELVMQSKQERSYIRASDKFQPHELPDAAVQSLCEQLSSYPQVQEAYLVQKVVKYLPKKPFYLLGVQRQRTSLLEVYPTHYEQKLLKRMINEIKFPGDTYVIILNKNNKNLARKLRSTPQAAIYRKVKN